MPNRINTNLQRKPLASLQVKQENVTKQAENKSINEAQTVLRQILDFLIGFLGSLIVANIAIVLVGQFDTPERLWISFFVWFWRLGLLGLAVLFFIKKWVGISIGMLAAILLQAFGI